MTGAELKKFSQSRWGEHHAIKLASFLKCHRVTAYRMYKAKQVKHLVEYKIKSIATQSIPSDGGEK